MRLPAEVWRRRAGRSLLALFMVAISAFSLWGGVVGLKSGVAPAPFRHEAPVPRAANPVGYWLAELVCLGVSPAAIVIWYRGLSAEVRTDLSPTLTALDKPAPGPTYTKDETRLMQAWLWIITGFVFLWAVFFMMFSDALSQSAHGRLPPPALDVVGSGAAMLLLGGTLLCYFFQMVSRNPNSPRPAGDAPRPPLHAPWPPLIGLVVLLAGVGGADQLGHHPDIARVTLILAAVAAALTGLSWWFWPGRRH